MAPFSQAPGASWGLKAASRASTHLQARRSGTPGQLPASELMPRVSSQLLPGSVGLAVPREEALQAGGMGRLVLPTPLGTFANYLKTQDCKHEAPSLHLRVLSGSGEVSGLLRAVFTLRM